MLEMLKAEMEDAHRLLEDVRLNLKVNPDLFQSLEAAYQQAESFLDHRKIEETDYWLGEFWHILGEVE